MSWRRMVLIVVALFPLAFLLWVWAAAMRGPVYFRFGWGGDAGLLVHRGYELRLMKLIGPQPELMRLPAFGGDSIPVPGMRSTYYLLHSWTSQPTRFELAVPQWVIVAAYAAGFMVIYVRLGVRGNRGMKAGGVPSAECRVISDQ
jgi:hypothetical protein